MNISDFDYRVVVIDRSASRYRDLSVSDFWLIHESVDEGSLDFGDFDGLEGKNTQIEKGLGVRAVVCLQHHTLLTLSIMTCKDKRERQQRYEASIVMWMGFGEVV